MRRQFLAILTSIVIAISFLTSCRVVEPVTDFDDLIDRINQTDSFAEITAETASNIHLSVQGLVIEVGDEDVLVFEYEESGQADIEYEALTGSGPGLFFPKGAEEPLIENVPVDRNCYHSGRFILLYDGSTKAVLESLQQALGEPLPPQ